MLGSVRRARTHGKNRRGGHHWRVCNNQLGLGRPFHLVSNSESVWTRMRAEDNPTDALWRIG